MCVCVLYFYCNFKKMLQIGVLDIILKVLKIQIIHLIEDKVYHMHCTQTHIIVALNSRYCFILISCSNLLLLGRPDIVFLCYYPYNPYVPFDLDKAVYF